MGYQTYFSLDIEPWDRIDSETVVWQQILGERVDDGWMIVAELHGGAAPDCTWYDCPADMLRLSAQYPGRLFTLKGWGQQRGDTWVQWFLNGQCTRGHDAEIHWPAFQPALLGEEVTRP